MDDIEKIILDSGYIKTGNYNYEKKKYAYKSVININNIYGKYLDFSMNRIYNNQEKIEIVNETRKITKLINYIKLLIDNEGYGRILGNYYHVEVNCFDADNNCNYYNSKKCDTDMYNDIINMINEDNFSNVDGLLDIHGIENGRCFHVINKEYAEKLYNNLYENKYIQMINKKHNNCSCKLRIHEAFL